MQPHEPALRAWLRSQYPSLRDVNDIVQESYLRLFRAREVEKVDSANAYLFGIARYVVMGVFRKERFISKIPVNELPVSGTLGANGSVLETVSVRQQLVLAADAIKTLPGRCREIVILHALHGMSSKEFAAHLGLVEATVRVQMARGVRKCAEFWRERGMKERDGQE